MSYVADTVVYAKPTGALDPTQRVPGVATYLAPDPTDPNYYINVRLTNGAGYYTAGGTSVSGGGVLTADQGAPALLSSAWPVKVTDGVSVFGAPGYPFYVALSSGSLGNQSVPMWVTGALTVLNPSTTTLSGSVVGLLYGGVPAGASNPFWVTGSVSVLNAAPSSVTLLSGSITGLLVGGAPVAGGNPVPVQLQGTASVTGSVSLSAPVAVSNVVSVTSLSGSLFGQLVGGQPVSQANPVPVLPVGASAASSGALSPLTASLTSQMLLAANPNRKGFLITNDSPSEMLIKYGVNAAATDYTLQLQTYGLFEPQAAYTGRVDVVWLGTATGSARVTELT